MCESEESRIKDMDKNWHIKKKLLAVKNGCINTCSICIIEQINGLKKEKNHTIIDNTTRDKSQQLTFFKIQSMIHDCET